MHTNPFHQRLSASLERLEGAHLRRSRRCVEAISTTESIVDGQRCLSFATNDYLGLTRHPRVLAAFAEAASVQAGAGASALIGGRSALYEELELVIAEFEGTESAVLYPSGFAANTGTLVSLIGPDDAVFCDRENHASLIDGCRASAGKFFVYDRMDIARLNESVARRRGEFDAVFIVTDTVFSMDGTLAELPQLCDIADRLNATMIVDEAHGTGVFGATGRGVCELQGVEHRIAVRIGTLSKAIGGLGGFVAGSTLLCEWLWNTARSQFFSTALPPAVCAAAIAAFRVVIEDPERRQVLAARAEFARGLLTDARLEVISSSLVVSASPIIGILLYDDDLAIRVARRLMDRGFFLPAVRPPTVAAGTARLRMSLCCDHTESQIETAVCQLREAVAAERL